MSAWGRDILFCFRLEPQCGGVAAEPLKVTAMSYMWAMREEHVRRKIMHKDTVLIL